MTDATATDDIMPLAHLDAHFYFAELHCDDPAAAARFYGELYGWTVDDVPGAPIPYAVASIDGRAKAGITTADVGADGRAYWLPYLYVRDLDQTLERLQELGGTVVAPAVEWLDAGRRAIALDPTGAHVGLWQDRRDDTTVKDEHGSPFWAELHTSDIDRAFEFYGALVGWTPRAHDVAPGMTYYTLGAPESDPVQSEAGGAMGLMQVEREQGMHSYWAVYLNSNDVDATWTRATEIGATSLMEPHDVPDVGRSSWITDPQGAVFATMRPNPRAGD